MRNPLKTLLSRLHKPRSDAIPARNVPLEMTLRDIDREREALTIKIAMKSGTTRCLG